MSTGFYENSNGTGVTPEPVITTGSDTGFFPTAGDPTFLTSPFTGVLSNSVAHIGDVSISNFPPSFEISNLPGTQRVEVGNFPAVQRVNLDFPDVQAVTGTLSINNLPLLQDVRIVNLPAVQDVIGRITIDNLPNVQTVAGTVSIDNLPAPVTSININNDDGTAIPVRIVGGGNQGGSSGGTFDGNVVLQAGRAHIGNVAVDAPVSLAMGTAVAVSSLPPITGTVALSGTSPVSLQGNATVQGSVSILNPVTSVGVTSLPPVTGTVAVSNFPAPATSISVNNLPAVQPVSISNTVSVTGTVALASNSVSISNKLKIDDASPIQVTVTNPSSGGGTFDGNVTVKGGTITVANPVTSVSVNNFPAPATSIAISNLPSTQPVSIANTVSVTGTVALASNSVAVSNFPAPVTSVSVNNLPTTQPVSISNTVNVAGTVSLASNTVNVSNSLKIDTSTPLQVTVTNPSSGGGSSSTGGANTLRHILAPTMTTGTFPAFDTGVYPDVATPFRSLKIDYSTSNDAAVANTTGSGKLTVQRSDDGSSWANAYGPITFTKGTGGSLAYRDAIQARYYRAVIDMSGFVGTLPTGSVVMILSSDSITGVLLSADTNLNVTLNTGDGPIGVNNGIGIPVVSIYNDPNIPVAVQGTVPVEITNLPASQAVTGTVAISNTANVAVQGTVPVSIASIPSHPVTISGTPTVALASNAVSVSNFPASQTVTGTVAIGGTANVAVQGTVPVSGTVAVSNPYDGALKLAGNAVSSSNRLPVDVAFPGTQAVTGSVSISGTPTVALASNSVSVSNFPVTQAVSGSITLTNPFDGVLKLSGSPVSTTNRLPVDVAFPSNQTISGYVSIENMPSVNVSGVAVTNGGLNVSLVGVTNAQLQSGGNLVGQSNPLYVAVTNPVTSIAVSNPVTSVALKGVDGTNPVATTNAIPVSIVGGTAWFETTGGTLAASATFTGTARANPGVGTVFVARIYNPITTPNGTLYIEGSLDGSAWTGSGIPSSALKSTTVAGRSWATCSIDASVYKFYRATFINGTTAQPSTFVVQTYFGAQTFDAPEAVTQSVTVVMTDSSGTISTGGTSQTLSTFNGVRRGGWVQNQSSGDLYINDLGTATIGGSSLKIAAGGYYEFPSHGVPATTLTIIGATTGQAFAARFW